MNAQLPLSQQPTVQGFFDPETSTISYVVSDPETKDCAVIDSVMDFDAASGTVSSASADKIVTYVQTHHLTVRWILETHVHADHLSAAPYLKEKIGGRIAISKHIAEVQQFFGQVFNIDTTPADEAATFDHLWEDGEAFQIGTIPAKVLYTPGHTQADLTYIIGDAAFVGDTLFMPDYGSARCDFPGGSAETLFASVQTLFTLSDETRIFLCHDYLPAGRNTFVWETTLGEQKRNNIHLKSGTRKEAFVAMRTARDATLGMPKLIIPSLQINIRGGRLPQPERNGIAYLKIPLNAVFSKKARQ